MTIVTCDFPPAGGGAVMRMAKLAKYLPELGWDVTVVCSAEASIDVVDQALRDEIPATVKVLTVRGPLGSMVGPAKKAVGVDSGGSVLMRRPRQLVRTGVKSVLIPDRWIGWARRVSTLGVDELGRPDVILSSGPPHSSHLAARRIAQRHGIPMVMDLRDDWAGRPTPFRHAPWHGPTERRLESGCIATARTVAVVSEASRANLAARYPARADRIVAIPNGFDPVDLAGLPARVTARTDELVRFTHAGSLRGAQVVGQFFEAFGRLVTQRPDQLSLELLGAVERPFRDTAVASIPSSALRLRDSVAHAEALRTMAAAHVLVVFTGGGGAGADTMTGKLYEYLALRRPILLVGPPGPAAELVAGSGAGIVADPHDAAGLAAAIVEAADLAIDPSFTGAPDEIIARFDRRTLAARWVELLRMVTSGSPRRPSGSPP